VWAFIGVRKRTCYQAGVMTSLYSEEDAAALCARYAGQPFVNEDVALRVYTSQLIGRDASLVLHGGGNTSVKTTLPDDLGVPTPVLAVKGSGSDLADLTPRDLPAVRLEPLLALRALPALSDEAMVNALRTRMLDASAPNPSVEALLHAFLPHRFIDHSHADALLALTDQPDGEARVREVYGERLAVVPYVMPGFALAKLAAEVYEANPSVEGLVLVKHGLFTFGETARESYERHVRAVTEAESFLAKHARSAPVRAVPEVDATRLLPVLRGRIGEGERQYVLELRQSPALRAFVDREDLADVSQRGCITPDHVIRTKRLPLVLDVAGVTEETLAAHVDARVQAFRDAYRGYVAAQQRARGVTVKALDPDPRVILVPGLGIIGVGTTPKAARIAADLYEHTAHVIAAAESLGRYEVLSEGDLFDLEYWSLEQAKLGKAQKKPLEGQVVYITGAARGIGAAIARSFAKAGAALYLVDREAEALAHVAKALGAAHEVFDITDDAAVRASMARCVRTYGGLDGCVSNAGGAPQSAMHLCTPEVLRASFDLNFFSHQWVAAAATNVMRAQGRGGFLLFNASKSAFNPGAELGPYAIAKAAVIALMKQYALEQGSAGIRVNAVNADRVRTGLLDQEDIARRARARGLALDAYYKSNLLEREVRAEEVGDAFVFLALAPSTTASVLTVDGGNIAASPR
jgi:rhamnose utilization protein RhaD (predicted bifunctional aldolase and dehydrogenase)/NAD(P)-dependent dehydrogenase (short-subunit alcohol dehydrogenase family)